MTIDLRNLVLVARITNLVIYNRMSLNCMTARDAIPDNFEVYDEGL